MLAVQRCTLLKCLSHQPHLGLSRIRLGEEHSLIRSLAELLMAGCSGWSLDSLTSELGCVSSVSLMVRIEPESVTSSKGEARYVLS